MKYYITFYKVAWPSEISLQVSSCRRLWFSLQAIPHLKWWSDEHHSYHPPPPSTVITITTIIIIITIEKKKKKKKMIMKKNQKTHKKQQQKLAPMNDGIEWQQRWGSQWKLKKPKNTTSFPSLGRCKILQC